MCIAILSTAHPDYPLIILSNRDEFIHRPTATASWWPPPDEHILAGRDLHRPEHGTWLGVTRQGRLAVLTNFREVESSAGAVVAGRRSRGAMVNAYLRAAKNTEETSEDVAKKLVDEGLSGVGGFSLLFGRLRKPRWSNQTQVEQTLDEKNQWKGLCVLSNRSKNLDDVEWICAQPGETHALSNSLFSDRSWPKVLDGEELVRKAIEESESSSEASDETKKKALISRFLEILSRDTLPQYKPDEPWDAYLSKLRQSIFIPGIGKDAHPPEKPDERIPISSGNSGVVVPVSAVWNPAMSGRYGTQKQTVILVDWEGNVKYIERTLFDKNGDAVPIGKGDLEFDFVIEGWND